MKLMVKICGMRDPENVSDIAKLAPDLMGFIFYPPSPRYVKEGQLVDSLKSLPKEVDKVAVTVDAPLSDVLRLCDEYSFSVAQLHGGESPSYCEAIRTHGIRVIKAFGVGAAFDFQQLVSYAESVDFFLFDTKTAQHGGSGETFDWEQLTSYSLTVPFFLSGGVSTEHISKIGTLNLPQLVGIDANSRLETKPALKDLQKTQLLIQRARQL